MEEQQEENRGRKREAGLKKITIGLMIGVALFFDALQVILDFFFMGWLVTIFGGMTFWFWFRIHGYSFMKPKRVAGSIATLLTDAVPVLGWLSWTIAITIFTLKNKIQETVPGGQVVTEVVSKTNKHTKIPNKITGAVS